MDTITIRIFTLLEQQRLEQKEFANKLGLSDKVVSAWKTGRAKSYTKYLPTIAQVLGTTVEYLVSGVESIEQTMKDSSLSEEEQLLVALFRQLPTEQHDIVLRMLHGAING